MSCEAQSLIAKIEPLQWPRCFLGPIVAPRPRVVLFVEHLHHRCWLYVLPNGDVLVAETNAPSKPDDAPVIRGWVMGLSPNVVWR